MKRLALVLLLAVDERRGRARRGPGAPQRRPAPNARPPPGEGEGRHQRADPAAAHSSARGRYKLYSRGSGGRASYVLSLEGAPNCLGANACFVATFAGKRGGKLPGRPNARLSSGDQAFFRMFSCGGSCSPNSFWFTHRGVLYSWQVKDLPKGERAIMIRMANEAIAAGPR